MCQSLQAPCKARHPSPAPAGFSRLVESRLGEGRVWWLYICLYTQSDLGTRTVNISSSHTDWITAQHDKDKVLKIDSFLTKVTFLIPSLFIEVTQEVSWKLIKIVCDISSEVNGNLS